MIKVSEYIVDHVAKNQTDTIFGHIGGFNANIVDMIYKSAKVKFVLNYHEQASSFACNAYAIVSGNVGVATSSGAPSTCNLLAGIATAYFDSLPCVFLVGSVHSLALRTCKSVRQNVFEEIDFVHLVSDITKYAVVVKDPNNIRYELEKAWYIALDGRRGPVVLDIPHNIARSEINVDLLKPFVSPPKIEYDSIDFGDIACRLKNSKRPIIVLGGGTRSDTCRAYIKKLLKKINIPVVASLCGLDVISHDSESYVGFIGDYGNRYANLALANSDFIIVLGSRLDERQMGGYQSRFSLNAHVIRVDVDKVELNRRFSETVSIYSSAENFLAGLILQDINVSNFSKWAKVIATWKKRYPSYNLENKNVEANAFLRIFSDFLDDNTIICSDVGQNQMCVAQAIHLRGERRLLNCAGYGSMGFSLPASIGAAYANSGAHVISINGDGGIQMNIQELQTIKRDNLPITIVILNNNCLGMIRRLQEEMYENRVSASVNGYSVPNYSAIAKAYGLNYLSISTVEEYGSIKTFIADKTPSIIEVFLPVGMKNYPEPGHLLDQQKPLLSKEEYEFIKKECEF